MTEIIVYHANCIDGMAALWAAKHRYSDAEEYAGRYDQVPDLERMRGKHVVIVDFSWKRPTMEAIHAVADEMIVLDHHKSAVEDLTPFADEMVGLCTCEILFDMNRSGAGLAWDHIVADRPRPKIIDYVEDRDLWRFALPHSKEISHALASYPLTLEMFDKLATRMQHPAFFGDLVAEGSAILRYHDQLVEEACATAYAGFLPTAYTPLETGIPIVITSNYTLFSDIGHRLLSLHPSAPYSACVLLAPDGKRKYSLRSEDSRADVSEVAKRFGGGGHRNAAGFEID